MKKALTFATLPILIFSLSFGFLFYMCWEEIKIKTLIIDSALSGNIYSIEMLNKYEKPWTMNKRIIEEAVDGNENALKILGIESKKEM